MARRRINRVTLDKTPAPVAVQLTPNAHLAVKLEMSLAENEDAPKWVHVATEGIFLGYHDGDAPFQFTRQTFEEIQSNTRSHPSYKAGSTGEGANNVIPWDFEHASEQPAVLGSLPATGAPAQGWVLDFDIREGAVAGKAELWALTKFLPVARDYIRAGQYQWASVAVAFDATHPVTGEKIGAICTSIALTNTPFIEGMAPLAASAKEKGAKVVQAGLRGYYEPADSPMDAVKQLRELFDLGETMGVDAVMNELTKVMGFVEAGAAPLGVDTDGIVGAVRRILGMSPLAPAAQVMVEAVTGLQGVIESAPGDLTPPSDAAVATAAIAATAAKDEGTENMDALLKLLASALECRASEEAVTAAVTELAAMRATLVTTLSADRDSIKVILAAAKTADDARATLGGILTALGVEDSAGGVDKIASLMKQAADLEEALPELGLLREAKEAADAAEVDQDVDTAIAASKLPASMKDALVLLHKSVGHAEFVKRYPVPTAPAAPAGVTASVATTPQGTELKVVGGQVMRQPVALAAGSSETGGKEVIDVAIYPGVNITEKTAAYLASKHANWSDLTLEDQMTMTFNLKRAATVVIGS